MHTSPIPRSNTTASVRTLHLSDTVLVRRSAPDVFDYAADFRRAPEWRTELVEAALRPDGPMRLGSTLREVAKVAGLRMVTETVIDNYDAPNRFTFRHQSGPLPVSGGYTVTPADGGAVLRYDLTVELPGRWRLLAPVFRLTGPRTMAASLDRFRSRLETIPTRDPELPR